ncbi:MAG TPA: hypothetical protein VJB05_04165 [archaeon]|nr:hypothetical protein [archaeon]
MSWEFKAIRKEAGKTVFADLSVEQQGRIPQYEEALRYAEQTQVPNPTFSNFYVRASAGVNSEYVQGGNIEYGFCQALHSEESLVAAVRSRMGRHDGMPIIAFSSLGLEPTCCGNCRDVLFDDFEYGEIVSGSPAGGIASVATFDDIKFDGFRGTTPYVGLCRLAAKINKRGEELVKDAYSGSQRHERNYFVGITTDSGFYYVGAHDVACDFQPIYAGRDAMRQARRSRDPFIKSIIVVSQEKPRVMYKDRQHLLELNIDGEMLSGQERNPPIFLVSFKNEVTGMWGARLKETMPFPFMVTAFGDEFIDKYKAWCKKAYRK